MHHVGPSTLFQSLSDEALTERYASGELTQEAQDIALAELTSRGLPVPPPPCAAPVASEPYEGDWTIVARNFSAIETHILCECLLANGIPARTADTNLVQTNALWAVALGGASVRVPANCMEEAKTVIAAFERGDFSLDDDFNVGDGVP